jgi:hypothetical protein
MEEASMTPDQMAELKWFIEIVGSSIIILQAVVGAILIMGMRRIAKNEVELADLIRQAVARIESDLPKK